MLLGRNKNHGQSGSCTQKEKKKIPTALSVLVGDLKAFF
jgi:hypothetical protein